MKITDKMWREFIAIWLMEFGDQPVKYDELARTKWCLPNPVNLEVMRVSQFFIFSVRAGSEYLVIRITQKGLNFLAGEKHGL